MRKVWKHILLSIMVVCLCKQTSIHIMALEADGLSTDSDMLYTEYMDLSDRIFQAGGYSEPSMSNMIATYAVNAREQLKAEIYQALKEEKSFLDVSIYGLTLDDLEELRNMQTEVINENPELFFVQSGLGYTYYSTGELARLNFYYLEYTDEEKKIYAEAIKCATAGIREDMTDAEKALVLHDYLAQNCAYAYKEYLEGALPDSVYTAFGALGDKRAVCQGYALAYTNLLSSVGIESYICSSQEMNHAWNVVLIDGEWYHVDVTWDDPVWNKEGRARHEYFLLSDAEMGNRKHYGWSDSVECISTKYDASDYWWSNVDSQIFIGEKTYYIKPNENSYGFKLMEKNGDSINEKYTNNTYWNVWNGGGYWIGAFSYLSVQGDYFYFNDKLNIYAMPISGDTPQVIYSYNGDDGYIYGAMVYGDGTAKLNISKEPNDDTDAYITVDLCADAPVLDVNYEAGTISTTSAMVYSTDGGNSWKTCTANMGLTEFGWNGSKDKTVLFKVPEADGMFESDVTEIILKALAGTTGGIINSFGEETCATTIQLIDANGTVVKTANVDGNSTEFNLGSVTSGTYTMQISKKNHVTREYTVTVGDEALSLDLEIHLAGDITGDGSINARDKKMLFNHISGITRLENYDLSVGDVNGDGTINARDKKMLFNHIAGISNLWE